MKNLLLRFRKFFQRFDYVSDLEKVSFLTLLLSALSVISPYSDVFSNGRAYILLSNTITEAQFGGIITFFLMLSAFSLYSGDLKFRFWVNIAICVFWVVQFTLFIVAQDYSGYLTWLVLIFAYVANKSAARIANAMNL
jgi:hypothetical protein